MEECARSQEGHPIVPACYSSSSVICDGQLYAPELLRIFTPNLDGSVQNADRNHYKLSLADTSGWL
jgi:hypothetical protein